MRHTWSEPSRPTERKTERECTRCGLIKVTRHEQERRSAGGATGKPMMFDRHWIEWHRGAGVPERIGVGGPTPVCEVVEVPA